MLGFIIWSMTACIFILIGISCRKSKEAVGFFQGVKPPEILTEKVKEYNGAVAKLWWCFAGVLEIIGLPILFCEQNSPVWVVVIIAVVLLMILMMVLYLKIENKYKKM